MTSQERHDARYQRRKAARQAKHRARIAQYDNFDRVADVSSLVDANYNARKGVMSVSYTHLTLPTNSLV